MCEPDFSPPPLMLTEKVSLGGQLPLLGAHYEDRSFSLASEKKNIQHQYRYAHLCPILITCGEWQLHRGTVHSKTTPGRHYRGELFSWGFYSAAFTTTYVEWC